MTVGDYTIDILELFCTQCVHESHVFDPPEDAIGNEGNRSQPIQAAAVMRGGVKSNVAA